MDELLISGGRVLDPAGGRNEVADVLVRGGIVAAIGPSLAAEGAERIDAAGQYVLPGLIDMHVHLREPGREDKETIASGTRAAAAGGFTTICCMPNTDPVIDSATGVNHILAVAARDGIVRVRPIAAVTRGQKGEEIAELGDLAHHGAIAFSDDGRPVANLEILRCALEYASMLGRPVLNHSEVPELVGNGVAHRGAVAARLGLRGIPSAAETASVACCIELAAETGGHIHICHVSTARAVEMIAAARARGVRITAEVTPHHLTLTEEAIAHFDTAARVAPPLRTAADRDAIRAGLRDGTIDCVATDHAPHTDIEKSLPFEQAPPGMIGLDFAFALLHEELVLSGFMSLDSLVERMTAAPARVLGLNAGSLCVGAVADITIFDPAGSTEVTRERVRSKSFNTPFRGRTFRGAVARTIVGGRSVWPPADGTVKIR